MFAEISQGEPSLKRKYSDHENESDVDSPSNETTQGNVNGNDDDDSDRRRTPELPVPCPEVSVMNVLFANLIKYVNEVRRTSLEHFHLRGQHLCKLSGAKESIYVRKEFNSHTICLGHEHACCFIFLEHQCGCHDM